jgi:glycosyltransferase involved in cell wall biosynthesis
MTKNQLKIYLEALEKRIGELIKEVQPDIIHVQHIWLTGYVVSKFDVPFVFTAHNTDQIAFEDPKCARFRRYVRKAVKKSRKIICISGQVFDNVRQLYKVRTKATIIFNGADPAIFHKEKVDKKKLLRKYKVKFHDYIVLMVGRLSVLKGIKYLLRAARYWESSGLDIGTIIIGEGIQRPKYEEYIKENLKNAYMLGHLMQKEIQDFYNIADFTVIPSLKEGFGLVAVESMLCGTPVIATDVGGLPEIITKKSGIIIKPKARFFIYKEGMNFLNNNFKRKMGRDCIKYAKRQFTWEKIILKMERVYKDATSS